MIKNSGLSVNGCTFVIRMQNQETHRIYLGLGSNQGNREMMLAKALDFLSREGCNIVTVSSLYETEAWGYNSDHSYLNLCTFAVTTLEPHAVLDLLLKAEKILGRVREGTGYTDRPIDIDLLYYDDLVMESPELVLPHPRIYGRNFVLFPLAEIAPDLVDPRKEVTVADLLKLCNDESVIRKLALNKEIIPEHVEKSVKKGPDEIGGDHV